MNPVGFSKVVAELALRNPPPLFPSCLIASMEPIGPRAIDWTTPLMASWMLTVPASVCTAPWPTMTRPKTKAMGKKMYRRPRVMSTQKLPTVGELRREKPRTSTMAAQMPMTGLTNCSKVRAPICEKYDIVDSPP